MEDSNHAPDGQYVIETELGVLLDVPLRFQNLQPPLRAAIGMAVERSAWQLAGSWAGKIEGQSNETYCTTDNGLVHAIAFG